MLLLLRVWTNPASAMSAILDRGSLLFASLSVLVASAILNLTVPVGFFMPLLVLAVFYVPGILILGSAIARLGGVGMLLQRDYSSMLTCSAMALAAAQLPLAGLTRVAPVQYAVPAAALYFALLMFFAIRTVLGID